MAIVTLEEAGWKKLCDKTHSNASALAELSRRAGYNIVDSQNSLLVEPRTFQRLYFLHATFARDTFNPDNAEFALDRLPDPKDYGLRLERPQELVNSFLRDQSARGLKDLRTLVGLCQQNDFARIAAKQVIPAFLEKFPQGRIHVVGVSGLVLRLGALLRVMSPLEIFDASELQPVRESMGRMMAQSHRSLVDNLGADTLGCLLYFLFPKCYGVVAIRPNCEVVFQLPEPLDSLAPLPHEVLDLARWAPFFSETLSREEFERLLTGQPTDEIARRWVCKKSFTPPEIASLIEWDVGRINDLYSYLFDLTKHVDAETGFTSPLLMRKRLLTIERIVAETNHIITERDSYVRKTLYFNLHDKYASLMSRPGDLGGREKVYNRLLKPRHFKQRLQSSLRTVPEPFMSLVKTSGEEIFGKVLQSVIDDIWATHRQGKKVVRGRKFRLGATPTGSPADYDDEQVDEESFACRVLHALRNTMHSYFLAHHGLERYLSLSRGIVPDWLPDLAWVFLFLLLDDAQGLFTAEWAKM